MKDEKTGKLEKQRRELPILFSGPMVRAILDGRKTVTRRLVSPRPPAVPDVVRISGSDYGIFSDSRALPSEFRVSGPVWAVRQLMGREPEWKCPYGAAGTRLWVRETWGLWDTQPSDGPERARVFYRATDGDRHELRHQLWRPSIFMPRWASRLTLEVVGVHIERLQEITEEGALAEGVESITLEDVPRPAAWSCRHDFSRLWDAINGKRAPWEENPFVWVVDFRREATD